VLTQPKDCERDIPGFLSLSVMVPRVPLLLVPGAVVRPPQFSHELFCNFQKFQNERCQACAYLHSKVDLGMLRFGEKTQRPQLSFLETLLPLC